MLLLLLIIILLWVSIFLFRNKLLVIWICLRFWWPLIASLIISRLLVWITRRIEWTDFNLRILWNICCCISLALRLRSRTQIITRSLRYSFNFFNKNKISLFPLMIFLIWVGILVRIVIIVIVRRLAIIWLLMLQFYGICFQQRKKLDNQIKNKILLPSFFT